MEIEEKTLDQELREIDLEFDFHEEESEESEEEQDQEVEVGVVEDNEKDKTKKEDIEKESEKVEIKVDAKVDEPEPESIKDDSGQKKLKDASSEDITAKLLARIDELQGQVKTPVEGSEKETEKDLENFLADLDMEEVQSDPDILNQILHKVVSFAYDRASENLQSTVPGLISSQVSDMMMAQNVSNQFYADNKDLSNVRNVVKACAEQVSQEHSDWTIENVLKEAADRTRSSLGIKKKEDNKISDINQASFAGSSKSGGSRNKQPKVSAFQQELDEL